MRLAIIILFLATTQVAAQKISITGQVADSTGASLPSATVMLLNPTDSTLVSFTLGKADGRFTFPNVDRKNYLLQITFIGYETYNRAISGLHDGPTLDLGTLVMTPLATQLAAIEIRGESAAVTIKKDTIEFNASSFKTRENAMVEDLLKRLPGVEVDNDGNITAQGQQVRNITVDGKKFFGSDPKVAMRNLPADAIERIQLFDRLSDQAEFTGIDDGEREKTINLSLKGSRRNATFGSLTAGGGTDERFAAKGSLNKFTRDRQLSFLGMANNTNDRGFGIDDYVNFTGGSRQGMGGGGGGMRIRGSRNNSTGIPLNRGNATDGLMNSYAAGVNVNEHINKNTEVNGSYFYNHLKHNIDQSTARETFLTNGSLFFDERAIQNNTNTNHRANITLDQKLDSLNNLRLNSTFSLNETSSLQRSAGKTVAPDGSLANETQRFYNSDGSRLNFNTSLLYRHRFGKRGRTLSTNLLFGKSQSDATGVLSATNSYYGASDSTEIIGQVNDQNNDLLTYGATISYTEPIGRKSYLEANYNFRRNQNDVDRSVYDVADGTPKLDVSLSNRYNSDYLYHRAGMNFRVASGNYNFVVGSSIQQSHLSGVMELHDTRTSKVFTNILPSVRFNYDFSSTRRLRVEYETSVREPDIQQLQPIVDNRDPLNVYVGNPDLRPSYTQTWQVNYNTFNPVSFISFFANVDVDYTTNAIVNAQAIDDRFVRTTMPVNVDKSSSIRTYMTLGIPVTRLSSRVNISANYRGENSVAVVNDMPGDILSQNVGGSLRYTFTYKEVFDITASARISRQNTQYESGRDDQVFLNNSYSAESNLSFLKHYTFNTNLQYFVYTNPAADFDQRIPQLNLSVSRFVLKNRSGEIKLAVNNVLDQVTGVDQTSSINYFERITTNSLGRYIMLSFTYSLNKALNPMSMRRGADPAMIRMRR